MAHMNKILVAIDGSEPSWKALDWAAEAAKLSNGELLILHVIHYEPVPDVLKELARVEHEDVGEEKARFRMSRTLGDHLTHEASSRAKAKGLERVAAMTVEGRAAQQIIAAVETHDVDTVVLGSRGFGAIKGLVLGSVSHKVANVEGCTCVIVK